MTQPALVSVCIPTFNGAAYLQATLDSIEAQTYPNIEVIVSDDGSRDDTLKIIEAHRSKSALPFHIHHNADHGIGPNWNAALGVAKGDYLKLMMQDDLLAPEFLSTLVRAAEAVPDAGLIFCRRSLLPCGGLTPSLRWLAMYQNLQDQLETPLSAGRIEGRALFSDPRFLAPPFNKIGEPTATLLTRRAIEKVGLFDADLKQALDYEYWYRLLAQMDAVFVDQDLATFRLHGEQATQQNRRDNERTHAERLRLYSAYRSHVIGQMSLGNKMRLLGQCSKTLLQVLWTRLPG
jgi:glycosyltransferase involved in cell wall biosynthesis